MNATYELLGAAKLSRALALVIEGRAVIEKYDDTRMVRSMGIDFPLPKVIRLLKALKVPFYISEEYFSRKGLLERDKHRCGYCGGRATTHDHIVPKSQGGRDEWMNAIAACTKCNSRKANRTPQEAGMPLLFEPTIPTKIYLRGEKKPRKKNK
jgi:5-methylcytosine-specific restriction endonuclease McrA